jgi:hypothetical protein
MDSGLRRNDGLDVDEIDEAVRQRAKVKTWV